MGRSSFFAIPTNQIFYITSYHSGSWECGNLQATTENLSVQKYIYVPKTYYFAAIFRVAYAIVHFWNT